MERENERVQAIAEYYSKKKRIVRPSKHLSNANQNVVPIIAAVNNNADLLQDFGVISSEKSKCSNYCELY